MDLTRTTIRIHPELKKEVQTLAIEESTTFQDVVIDALHAYIQTKAKKKAKKLVFHAQSLGVPLDNLTRADFYDDRL